MTPSAAWAEAIKGVNPMRAKGLRAEFGPSLVRVSAEHSTLAILRSERQDRAVEHKVRELAGAGVKVEWVEAAGMAPASPPEPKPVAAATGQEAQPLSISQEEFRNDPDIQAAREKFGAKLKEIRARRTTT